MLAIFLKLQARDCVLEDLCGFQHFVITILQNVLKYHLSKGINSHNLPHESILGILQHSQQVVDLQLRKHTPELKLIGHRIPLLLIAISSAAAVLEGSSESPTANPEHQKHQNQRQQSNIRVNIHSSKYVINPSISGEGWCWCYYAIIGSHDSRLR